MYLSSQRGVKYEFKVLIVLANLYSIAMMKVFLGMAPVKMALKFHQEFTSTC